MTVEFLTLNFVIKFLTYLFVYFVVAVGLSVIYKKVTKFFIVGVPLALLVAFLLSYQQSGHRFVLTDEVKTQHRLVPSEIRSFKKKGMTDQERLDYNKKLIEENK